jgi:Uma2 family endonuclease
MTTAVRHFPLHPSATPSTESQPPHPKRWTKKEYYELVDRGAFQGQRIYLFRGEIIEFSRMGNPHAVCVTKANSVFFKLFPSESYYLRVRLPFDAPGESVPEPDLAVCTLQQAFVEPHPTTAVLVIEASDSSITHDRDKALEYAAAGVPEYWIVDLSGRCVEIYRNPVPDSTAPLGFRYPPPTVAKEDQTLSPLALANAGIKVADLLP